MCCAAEELNISDGGNWIDPLARQLKLADHRLIDYYHAVEHIHTFAAAMYGKDTPGSESLGVELESLLWEGKVDQLILRARQHARPSEKALPDHTAEAPPILHRERPSSGFEKG